MSRLGEFFTGYDIDRNKILELERCLSKVSVSEAPEVVQEQIDLILNHLNEAVESTRSDRRNQKIRAYFDGLLEKLSAGSSEFGEDPLESAVQYSKDLAAEPAIDDLAVFLRAHVFPTGENERRIKEIQEKLLRMDLRDKKEQIEEILAHLKNEIDTMLSRVPQVHESEIRKAADMFLEKLYKRLGETSSERSLETDIQGIADEIVDIFNLWQPVPVSSGSSNELVSARRGEIAEWERKIQGLRRKLVVDIEGRYLDRVLNVHEVLKQREKADAILFYLKNLISPGDLYPDIQRKMEELLNKLDCSFEVTILEAAAYRKSDSSQVEEVILYAGELYEGQEDDQKVKERKEKIESALEIFRKPGPLTSLYGGEEVGKAIYEGMKRIVKSFYVTQQELWKYYKVFLDILQTCKQLNLPEERAAGMINDVLNISLGAVSQDRGADIEFLENLKERLFNQIDEAVDARPQSQSSNYRESIGQRFRRAIGDLVNLLARARDRILEMSRDFRSETENTASSNRGRSVSK